MSIKINIKGIEEDILKYMKIFSQEYAKEGSRQITKQAQSCIEMFYRDYTPTYYNRTYDLKNKSYVPYLHNNGKTYYGGVRITARFMSPYRSNGLMNSKYTEPIIVAQLAWHGWHGDPTGCNGKFTPIFTTPPLNVLLNFTRDETFLVSISKTARTKASKHNYKYLDIRKVGLYVG